MKSPNNSKDAGTRTNIIDTLLQLINRRQWDEALNWIESHVEEIQRLHTSIINTHRNLFYTICEKFVMHCSLPVLNNDQIPNMVQILEKIHEFNPNLSTMGQGDNMTPLHLLLREYVNSNHYHSPTPDINLTQNGFRSDKRYYLFNIIIMIIQSSDVHNTTNTLLQPLHSNGCIPLHGFLKEYIVKNVNNNQRYPWFVFGSCNSSTSCTPCTNLDQDDIRRVDNEFSWRDLIYKVLITKPQCLIIPNKGGVTCFEMFWDAFSRYYDNDDDDDSVTSNGMSADTFNSYKLSLCSEVARQWYYNTNNRDDQKGFMTNGMIMNLNWNEYYENHDNDERISFKTKYTRYCYYWIINLVKIALMATKTRFMVKNESHEDDSNGDGDSNDCNFLPIHSILYIPFAPMEMIRFILYVHGRNELQILNPINGNSPLHILLLTTANNNDNDNILYRNRSKEDISNIIQIMLNINPLLASIPNDDGYYPFFLALKNGNIGWDDGLSDILQAYPDVIYHVDPVCHFNVILYASVCWDGDGGGDSLDDLNGLDDVCKINQLNNTFQILQKFPNLVNFRRMIL